MASIDQIMVTDLVTAAPEQSAADAARQMRDGSVGAVLVVDGGQLVGIFTERDLLERVVAEGLDPASTKLSQVHTPDPQVVRRGTHVKKCANTIRSGAFRHLPVVDDDGKPVGIISSRVFLQHMVDVLEGFVDRALYEKRLFDEHIDPYEGFGGGYRAD